MTSTDHPSPAPRSLADRWALVAARAGSTAMLVGSGLLVAIGVAANVGLLELLPRSISVAIGVAVIPALIVSVFGFAAMYGPRPAPRRDPVPLRSPVRGRWSALNSPATKVPSHGLHLFGQTYAIDLTHEPEPGSRPSFGGHPMRDPREYPAFGQPVYAPLSGTVASVHDRRRDHRCRSNLLGFLYMMVEGLVVQYRGPAGVMGNRIVIEHDDGVAVVLAHLQRGSATVAPGDRVEAGEVIAAVGNSGNSSEPHMHLQVCDRVHPLGALGLPFTFTDVVISDAVATPAEAPSPTVPENEAVFHGGVVASDAQVAPDPQPSPDAGVS